MLQRTGPEPIILIDGRSVSAGRLPAEKLLGRRLIKVAKDLCIVSLNPNDNDQEEVGSPQTMPVHAPGTIQSQKGAVETVTAKLEGHESKLCFDPPFPDITSLQEAMPLENGVLKLMILCQSSQAGIIVNAVERMSSRLYSKLRQVGDLKAFRSS